MTVIARHSLTPVQAGMLVNRLQAPDSGVDIEQLVLTLPEAIDSDALFAGFASAVARHPSLRTIFAWEGLPAPEAHVLDAVTLPTSRHDWRELTPAEQASRLDAFLVEDRRAGFDVSRPPLLRLALFRLGDADYRLVWTFFHGILDGGSFARVLREAFGETLPAPTPYAGPLA